MKYITSIVLALMLLLFAVTIFNNIGIGMLFNHDSLIIIFGGTTVALIVGFPLKRIQATVVDVIDTFRNTRGREVVIADVLEIARLYRSADIRGLEKKMSQMRDDFLRIGISLLINHHKSEGINNIMEREMNIRMVEYYFSENLLKTVARLTPSFGLAGTVISLIKMFHGVHSLDVITPSMSVALMSTFYGVILSNLIMLPLHAKLRDHAISSETIMSMIIEGFVAINNMEHPLRVEEKMRGYHQGDDIRLSGVEPVSVLNKSAIKV
ncbi:MAG: MotA/TolQ/ExbB proton channel family protein [Nitrospirota bacterium]